MLRSYVVSMTALCVAWIAACGDDDDPGEDPPEPLTVTETSPDDGGDWLNGAPIRVVFSHPVQLESLSGSVSLATVDGELDFSSELSADGTTLVLTPPAVGVALPTDVTLSLAETIRSVEAVALEPFERTFHTPLWYSVRLTGGGSRSPAIAAAGGGFVASWIEDGQVEVARFSGGEIERMDTTIEGRSASLASTGDTVYLAVADAGGGLRLHTLALDPLAISSTDAVGLANEATVAAVAATADQVVLAWREADQTVRAASKDGGAFSELGTAQDSASDTVDIAIGNAGPVLVFDTVSGPSARVHDGAWTDLSDAIDGDLATDPRAAAAGGNIYVSWRRHQAASAVRPRGRTAQLARRAGSSWDLHGAATYDAASRTLATDVATAGGETFLAWTVTDHRGPRGLVARHDGDRYQPFGGSVGAGREIAVAVGKGVPATATAGNGGLVLSVWNGSSEHPVGHASRDPGDCEIPSTPPDTLSETGCYADVSGQGLIPGAIPFSIRAPLWSDGAWKRRYLVLPAGETIAYSEDGPWSFPVGTTLIKEFWIEGVVGDPTTRIPVETRFLVKRCNMGACIEPWQGYSYQWRAGGEDADLLDGFDAVRVEWTVMDGGSETTREHIYPSSFDCTRCHNDGAGRVLGLRTAQVNGIHEYADVAAEQLPTLRALGVFTDDPELGDLSGLPRLARHQDPMAAAEQRVRGYLHANCAHCHNPAGEQLSLDLRYGTSLTASGMCDNNRVVAGDASSSQLYLRDSTRDGAQMPPLATDLTDDAQLAVLESWINSLASCP